jgi:hypothetical protein
VKFDLILILIKWRCDEILSCKVGKRMINTVDERFSEIKKWSQKGILKCPLCGSEMIFKNGLIKVPHFAHKDECTEDVGFWENETKEHHLGKQFLYKWIKQLAGVENIQLEKWIPETKQRPDIAFELYGEQYVVEYQCSPITLEHLQERKRLYELNGLKDIWIFGSSNHSFMKLKSPEKWLIDQFNRVYYFDPIEDIFIKKEKEHNGIIYNKERYYKNVKLYYLSKLNDLKINHVGLSSDEFVYVGDSYKPNKHKPLISLIIDVISKVRNKKIVFIDTYSPQNIDVIEKEFLLKSSNISIMRDTFITLSKILQEIIKSDSENIIVFSRRELNSKALKLLKDWLKNNTFKFIDFEDEIKKIYFLHPDINKEVAVRQVAKDVVKWGL